MTRREAIELTHRLNALQSAGISYSDAEALRRISMTLRRWHELECGNEYGCIQRENEDGTGRPYWQSALHASWQNGYKNFIPDRETGAKKRLAKIMTKYPTLQAYIQGDPRGAALYILRPGDVPEGQEADSYYSRGLAIY